MSLSLAAFDRLQVLCRPPAWAGIRAALVALAAAGAAASAGAHDTWLEERARSPAGIELALTTGALFPRGETPVAADALLDRGCVDAAGAPLPLRAGRLTDDALRLQAPAAGRRSAPLARSCRVQTMAFDVEVAAPLVPVYLREIGAPAQLHAAWQEQQRQGLPWIERYTKHARISFAAAAGARAGADATVAPLASAGPPMALEIEIDDVADLRAGQTLAYRVLRDGQPLAGQAVELRGDVSRVGLWRRTDAEGRASITVPLPGRWALRATDLRPVPELPGHWVSRFVTHTFTVASAVVPTVVPATVPDAAARASNYTGQPSIANARWTNHAKASAAIASEPPTSTPRR
jgi:hypothetical protein